MLLYIKYFVLVYHLYLLLSLPAIILICLFKDSTSLSCIDSDISFYLILSSADMAVTHYFSPQIQCEVQYFLKKNIKCTLFSVL